jgi:hypothetical protein
LLRDGQRLAREERLVAFQITDVPIQHPPVRRDDVPVLQQDEIAGDDLLDWDGLCDVLPRRLVADDIGLWRTDGFE